MSQRPSDLFLFRRLMQQARSFWPHLGLLFTLNALGALLRLAVPLPLMIGVDCVLSQRPLPGVLASLQGSEPLSTGALLALSVALLLVITFVGQLLGLAALVLSVYAGEKLVVEFRTALFRNAQRLSLAYHDARGTSDSTFRIQYDAPCIQWVVVDICVPLVTAVFTLVAMVWITARLDLELAAVALTIAPALFALTHVMGRRLRTRADEQMQASSAALAVVQEVLGGLRVVKAFGQEKREEERFAGRSQQGLRAHLRVITASGAFGLLVAMITALGTAAVLYLGVQHVQSGQLTLGELLLVLAYLAQLYAPLETISKKFADLQGSLACAQRALTLLDEAPDVVEHPQARPLVRARGALRVENVSFAYTPEREILRHVSVEIPAGACVGISGTTGSGKTTFVQLLVRFFDPTEGRILLDGVDLREYRLADLRAQFSLVQQEPLLFATSIAENIAYARPHATRAEIEAAARDANAHDFITALPAGYETVVGERGMQLSGGERQRLALARAFLKNAPLLILDEPTSAVDVQTESGIIEALHRLMQGRTTFMIAHRLATLERCDLRLHLEGGNLVVVDEGDERRTASAAKMNPSLIGLQP